jgi:response regulator RpfG family c-di-GMP phosphodiesterase
MTMAQPGRARILIVDDEAEVLEGLERHLHAHFDLTVASDPKKALKLVVSEGPYAVVVADLRMPGMDGVTLLYSIRTLAPDTVRVLLTGFADLDAAMAAVNEGNIFRFLSKPCPSKTLIRALEASVEQHRLFTSQRVLLEQTLRASLKILTDILAIVNPEAFGRTLRTRQLVSELAASDPVSTPWQSEIAAMLAQIGWITLPGETASRLYQGRALTASEQAIVDKLPTVTEQLLGDIPRLEYVREILKYQDKHYDGQGPPGNGVSGEAIPWGSRALKAASDFDVLEAQGCSVEKAIETMQARSGWYDPAMLEAISRVRDHKSREARILHLPLRAVRAGMVFTEDVKTRSGPVLLARGQEATPSLVERIKNLGLDSEVDDTVVVSLP